MLIVEKVRIRGFFQKEFHLSTTERQNACQLFAGAREEDEEET
jgi:hypothetical protein